VVQLKFGGRAQESGPGAGRVASRGRSALRYVHVRHHFFWSYKQDKLDSHRLRSFYRNHNDNFRFHTIRMACVGST
jgi:hypothetical protein